MAGVLPGDLSHHGIVETSPYRHDRMEENAGIGGNWYLSRKDIEENSPSRRDGIDLKKEAYLRKSYCTFLQDLGMRLKVPQVTIATAIVFCHRFFLRQSHGKNDRRTVATVCMFLAGKVEETPRPLKDVILVSYEIIHKKDPAAIQRIKQREVYEQQKELILLGERAVLTTLGFDLNVHHPYKPLVEAIKKFKVAQNALAQVAWNFVNDGLRTSLCLQFKPHHIAAGAIFLAAKFLKVKLPSDGDKVWWQEFDVTPRQLEEVSNQMLELYEQTRAVAPSSHGNEAEGSSASAVATHQALPKTESSPARHKPNKNTQNEDNSKDSSSTKAKEGLKEQHRAKEEEPSQIEAATTGQTEEKSHYSSPSDAMNKIDKSKVKAALEKRRKEKGEVARKIAVMDDDDDDLIERELESGIELAAEGERMKKEDDANSVMENVVEEEGEFRSPRENKMEKYDDIQLNSRSISARRQNYRTHDADVLGQIERDEKDHKRRRLENHVIDD